MVLSRRAMMSTKSANRNPVENNMRRNLTKDKSKKPYEGKKNHIDFGDLLIENAFSSA